MEYWQEAVAEALSAEGVIATDAQIAAVAGWMRSAHECHSEQTGPRAGPAPVPRPEPTPEPKRAWWEDVSRLSGRDWVMANRIHELIASRYS